MTNQRENASHRPIVLQAALAEAQTSATPIGQTPAVPESELHTPIAVRTTIVKPALEPRVTIAVPSSTPTTKTTDLKSPNSSPA
ncbi:unnamed protein product [Cochlearia groenlandica]